MRTAVDSRSGLKRYEEQRSNHSEGEQRGLDGVREVHVTNIDSMVTSTNPAQRTYSQRIGGADGEAFETTSPADIASDQK